jgi:hypothetical protein
MPKRSDARSPFPAGALQHRLKRLPKFGIENGTVVIC